MMVTMNDHSYKIDFGKEMDGENWVIVNDGVMGGKSESNAQILDNSILFKGEISLRNNGGFASLRNRGSKLDLSKFNTVKIRFKTNTDRKFSFRLSASDRFYRPFFKHNFGAESNNWEVATLSLLDFKEHNLNGETGKKLGPEEMKDDFRMGIILYDKQQGPFEIEIDYIEFN